MIPAVFLRPEPSSIASKSDEELHYCIDNREKYLPENVEVALAELKSRGAEFSEEEIKAINEDLEAHRELATASNSGMGFFNSSFNNNIVDDPDAYNFYSRRIVKVFTFFFGVLFGSIMLAINIGKTKNKTGVIVVLAYGLVVTVVEILLGQQTKNSSSLAVIFGFFNAYTIDYFFWNRYLGNGTFYRTKSYWIPLVIGIVMVALIFLAIIYGGG
jgi:hypothetical protein